MIVVHLEKAVHSEESLVLFKVSWVYPLLAPLNSTYGHECRREIYQCHHGYDANCGGVSHHELGLLLCDVRILKGESVGDVRCYPRCSGLQ